ncbi:MAG: hypothetical protein VX438_02125 [Planctomycetota bacterium]|nr:hypothetical protein [Planctomycetota bacterium]
MINRSILPVLLFSLFGSALLLLENANGQQRIIVPGTGQKITNVGDDFEDVDWGYNFRMPKSSENIDKKQRSPYGRSTNSRWYEGVKRGDPDVIQRIATPAGGIAGSQGALLLKTLNSGIPGRKSYKMQQDDFICNIHSKIGTTDIKKEPSCVTRVYLPPVDTWENRTGPHFAFRIALEATVSKPLKGFIPIGNVKKNEVYWPGMFIEFESKHNGKKKHDYAWIRVRGDRNGYDFKTMQITKTGWWTLGMSVTQDGAVHYFAKPGVEDLTIDDRITSQVPYGYRAERFRTFFFNVCNGDNGKTWSTDWVIDDPSFYVSH